MRITLRRRVGIGRWRLALALFLTSGFGVGCAHLGPELAYFDPVSYQNFTQLKPEVLFMYDRFSSEPLDRNEVRQVQLHIAQVYEYERGKGAKNKDTVDQVARIQGMVGRHVKERTAKSFAWAADYVADKKESVAAGFDLLIEGENSKNRRH